jgi:cytochrome c oxidase subunit 4
LAYGRYALDYTLSTYLRDLISMQTPHSNKKNTLSWVWLMTLTVVSTYIGLVIDNKALFIASVLFIVFLKGQQIIDIFMELAQAPKFWRRLLLGYVTVLPTIIALIYLL